jgi:AraC-like DNA-binding protein
MRWGLYVTGAGRGVIPAGQPYPPRGHPNLYQFTWQRGRILPEFQIILIVDGQGIFESETTGNIEVSPNTLLLLFPGIWHRYRPALETGWHERWLSLNGEICHRLLNQGHLRADRPICQINGHSPIIAHLDDILDRIHANPSLHAVTLSLRVMALIAEILDEMPMPVPRSTTSPSVEQKNDPLVEQALDLIWTHSHHRLTIEHLIDQLPRTRRTLERRFRQERGHSLLEEIHYCRLSRAKRLLYETDLPIKTVAYLAGFSDAERLRITLAQSIGAHSPAISSAGPYVTKVSQVRTSAALKEKTILERKQCNTTMTNGAEVIS